jgi:spore coat polysaccharide biosynthesis predicted glycosyltransferase SpsG
MTGGPAIAGAPRAEVLFVVAAGPRRGFGHLRRAISLARALGVLPVVAIRGDVRARRVARGLGAHPVTGTPRQALATLRPRALVIDDPNARATRGWRAAARTCRTPVVAVVDLGIGLAPCDLLVDGSITARAASRRVPGALLGPRYAILDPRLRAHRRRPEARPTVLIALGGGPHADAARRLARHLRRLRPDVEIRIAAGFAQSAPAPADGVVWLPPLPGLGAELGRCTVAVLGGGVSLYEGCALGVPTVAASVVAAQRPAIEGFARLGAIVDGGRLTAAASARQVARLARHVAVLLGDRAWRARLGARARRLVDGRGASRVARAIRRVLPRPAPGVARPTSVAARQGMSHEN